METGLGGQRRRSGGRPTRNDPAKHSQQQERPRRHGRGEPRFLPYPPVGSHRFENNASLDGATRGAGFDRDPVGSAIPEPAEALLGGFPNSAGDASPRSAGKTLVDNVFGPDVGPGSQGIHP